MTRYPMTRYVYDFDEPADGGRDLLGGKGIGLAEMTQLGIPVPAGFTITTDACRAFMASGGEVEGLDEEVAEHIARLEEQTGKRFGDPEDPLLVSVRSGAAISMPGMMDSILNVGLNDESVAGLGRSTGNDEFARDCYRRMIQMVGETVDDSPHESFSVDDDVERAREIYERETGHGFPQDANEQLKRAIAAVFESWNSSRAQVYRRMYAIPDDLGTAVNVVQMVFGNKGEDSATGVGFTRDPSTGEQGVYGEYLVNAQGEDVVAGVRTPQPLAELRERMPEAYDQLLETIGALERHYRDMQDIEFTVEEGRLYLLQTRTAKRTAAAAIRCAVDMTAEGLIERDEAVARIDPTQLDQLLHPRIDPVTIDGGTGRVIAGEVRLVPPAINEDFETILEWADELRRLKVRANADNADDAAKAREFGAQGIGLCRTEHMFFGDERLPVVQEMILARDEEGRRDALDRLLPFQQSDFEAIFEAMAGLPVTIRLLDPPLHEFLPDEQDAPDERMRQRIRTLREANPMLGTRGCRLGLQWPEIYEMQVRAIVRAAKAVQERTGEAPLVEIMHPLVGFEEELRRLRELTVRVAEEEEAGDYLCGTMIALLRACVRADAIAEQAYFFSVGTNDLTQTARPRACSVRRYNVLVDGERVTRLGTEE